MEADSTIKRNYNVAACRKIRNTLNKLNKMKRQRNMQQMKEHSKNPLDKIDEEETGNQPGKEFRVSIIKMIQNLGNKMKSILL